MEQKDYILNEIEKISLMLRAILNSLTGNKENLAITIDKQFEETKEKLLNDINFDLEHFLTLDDADSKIYISRIKGINISNIELLAEILFLVGLNLEPESKLLYFEKALSLLDFCNQVEKTFSFERENKIKMIKNAL